MHAPAKFFVALIIGMLAGIVLALEFLYPHLYLARDSFTYFTMARQFHETGLLFSYTGLDHTTGTHPGYYFFMLLFYPLFTVGLPEWSFVIGALTVAAGIFALYRAHGPVAATVVSLLVLSPYGASLTNNGMESSLVFLGLALFVWFLSAQRELDRKRALCLGLLLGAVLFARLDLVFLVPAFFVSYALLRVTQTGWSKATLLGVASQLFFVAVSFLAVLIPTLILYFVFGGSPLPISGALKSSFPHLSPEWMLNIFRLKIFIASVAISGIYLAWRFATKRDTGVVLPTLFLATLALYLYNGLFASGMGAWYGTPAFFTLALVASLVCKEIKFDRWPLVTGLLVLVLAFGIAHRHLTLAQEDWVTPHRAAAQFLDRYGEDGRAAAELKDGVFAFYSSRPVYSLTGLANNMEYVEAVKQGRLAEYFERKHIDYVVGGSFYSGVQVPGHEMLFIRDCHDPFYGSGIVQIFYAADCLSAGAGRVD